jgi:hypothetical protein
MPTVAATPELEPLQVFIGRWINEGETVATPDTPSVKILTSDVYEWVPGGFFVLHSAYGRVGNIDVGSVEIIGYDADVGTFRTHFFTSSGGVSSEVLTFENGGWVWQGRETRATSVFSDDEKTQMTRHERRDTGEEWIPAMNVTLSRVQ